MVGTPRATTDSKAPIRGLLSATDIVSIANYFRGSDAEN